MKKKIKTILWGLFLICIGVVVILKALDINLDFNPLFKGWWTLFIIVPCAIEFFTERYKLGSFIGILFGVSLLLAAREIIEYSDIWKLILPALLIILGVYIIFRAFVKKKETPKPQIHIHTAAPKNASDAEYTSIFSGEDINFNGRPFYGTSLSAIFGGIDCDLRGAIIEQDVTITANAIFGGIDIDLPPYVRVVVNSSASIFGGVENNARSSTEPSAPTVTVIASGIFGGVEIK